MDPLPLPWQSQQWQQLVTLFKQQRLPSALLFKGPQGIGKLLLAKIFAQLLLCLQPQNNQACQHCKACHLFAAHTHPDYQLLQANDEHPLIKIDQIREITHFCSLSKQVSQHKVIIIENADAMNIAAANAFLKTLEEPSAHTCILLLSHQASLLPATIRSRCQAVNFVVPTQQQAINWLTSQPLIQQQDFQLLLSLAGKAPLLVLEYANNPNYINEYHNFINSLIAIALNKQDPIAAVTPWAKHNPQMLLKWLHLFLADIICTCAGATKSYLVNNNHYETLRSLASQTDSFTLLQLLDKLKQTMQYLHEKINLNFVLLLEDLLCEWYFLFHKMENKC